MPKSKNQYEEIECKFLDIDRAKLEKDLVKLGAEKKFSRLFRRYVMDYPDLSLNATKAWLRVRDEGDKVTLAYKQRQNVTDNRVDGGMKEIEVTVSDFEKTYELFKAIGLKSKFYEENRRTLYVLDGVEIAIDEWPMIPAYVEIEGEDWDSVQKMAEKLGFDYSKKLVCSTLQVYEHYGIDEESFSVNTFDRQEKAKR